MTWPIDDLTTVNMSADSNSPLLARPEIIAAVNKVKAMLAPTNGTNIGIGTNSMQSITTGTNNTGFGNSVLSPTTTGVNNSAFGYRSLASNTTGGYNSAFGYQSLAANTTGSQNTAIGNGAMSSCTSGSDNSAIGPNALSNITIGASNAAFGHSALISCTGTNNVAVGKNSGSDALFNVITESDRAIFGNNSTTNAYIKVAWTVVSDARDKSDVTPCNYGLEFVNHLNPIKFRWDERSKYSNGIPDGTHKSAKFTLGLLAQEVISLEKLYGATDGSLLVADDEIPEHLKITEAKLIPVLIKAIQELSAKNAALEARLTALEAA